jgi:hypothetical protein
MTRLSRNFLYFIGGVVFAMMLGIASADADNKKHPPAQNDPVSIENYRITTGVSNSDLAKGLATVGAAQHQFDYSTTDLQFGISGAWYDDKTAISLGIAKRFAKDSWAPNALFHGSFSGNGGSGNDNLLQVGATFRL